LIDIGFSFGFSGDSRLKFREQLLGKQSAANRIKLESGRDLAGEPICTHCHADHLGNRMKLIRAAIVARVVLRLHNVQQLQLKISESSEIPERLCERVSTAKNLGSVGRRWRREHNAVQVASLLAGVVGWKPMREHISPEQRYWATIARAKQRAREKQGLLQRK
jgi:hypothetical protein